MSEGLCLKCGKLGHQSAKCRIRTKGVGCTRTALATKQEAGPMARKATDQTNRHRVCTRAVGKRRMSQLKDRLWDRPERTLIITANDYAALSYREILANDKNQIMVKQELHKQKKNVRPANHVRIRIPSVRPAPQYAWYVSILHSFSSGAHCVATPLIFAIFSSDPSAVRTLL